jgi:protoporphyrinogen oxidase
VRDGYRFDLGGHRFFTKCPEVEELWQEVLGEELLLRPRLSRIYYRGRFLDYPLRAGDVLAKLGPLELTLAFGSYVNAALRHSPDENFEQWVSSRFGRRLYEMFFRSYTEKVWGVPCTDLRAEWAAQRIRGLSLASLARNTFFGQRNGNGKIKSLITEFLYPRFGPGQMWETMSERIVDRGGSVFLETPVERLVIENGAVTEVVGGGQSFEADHVISSLPLGSLAGLASPAAPTEVREAALGLRYRDFLTVALVVRGDEPFPDNWVYVHDPDVKVARMQNYRAWSPWMVPNDGTTSIGMEYFCFEGDELWSAGDDELVELASEELRRTGLLGSATVERGYVVRVPKAYPIYDVDYAERVQLMRGWLGGVRNLQQVGRNGLHRYNNSDHSMLTAMCAVENMDGAKFDLWSVNADSWYSEEVRPEEQPYIRAPALSAAVGE